VRRLKEADADVQVVLTRAAGQFVGPLMFQALSGRPVRSELFDMQAEAAMGHIELARWADAVLIAPATANLIAKLAHGLADDLLSTLCLATAAPLVIAPAMNRQMWANPATQANVAFLIQRGVKVLGPGTGAQACGEVGEGRMLEPQELAQALSTVFGPGPLENLRVMITAGPTRDPLDPVRFIGNRSSGRMGFALAQAASEAGASVHLIAGPVSLPTPANVGRTNVETASQMHAAVMADVADQDIFIACAAVADYRPAHMAEHKIKKTRPDLSVELVRNPDILAEVAARPQHPFTVGFAAETENVEAVAAKKREAKRLDMIAANKVGGTDSAFESLDNALTVLWNGGRLELRKADKATLARQLIALIAERYATTRQ
jgi:phosphopantothenoylcysteine decarboxylase/phosphopantothenate--cysteine ligase